MLIPCLLYQCGVISDRLLKLAKGTRIKSVAACKPDHWHYPEFSLSALPAHMNVNALARITFVGIEEKPEPFMAKYDGIRRNPS